MAVTLFHLLRGLILSGGPITTSTFMKRAVRYYYANSDIFGVQGDFTTAPEISQTFGELIGLWFSVVWQVMGTPSRVHLVELGPGRGTLMADLLRAVIQVAPVFYAALSIHLIEESLYLVNVQQMKLAPLGIPIIWHKCLDSVPHGPTLIIANEFLDALPIRQFEYTRNGWCERRVGLSTDRERLCFVLCPICQIPSSLKNLRTQPSIGTIFEESPDMQVIIRMIATRLSLHTGAALLIDYGVPKEASSSSLQAIRHHMLYEVLGLPGEIDLSACVDFSSIMDLAVSSGARGHGPISQGEWLRRLGILTRAHLLMEQALPAQAPSIATSIHYLINDNTMGDMFQVLGLSNPAIFCLPGLS